MNDDDDEYYRCQLKRVEERYRALEKHVVDNDLGLNEIPLLDKHLTEIREEIVELKQVLGIYYAV